MRVEGQASDPRDFKDKGFGRDFYIGVSAPRNLQDIKGNVEERWRYRQKRKEKKRGGLVPAPQKTLRKTTALVGIFTQEWKARSLPRGTYKPSRETRKRGGYGQQNKDSTSSVPVLRRLLGEPMAQGGSFA